MSEKNLEFTLKPMDVLPSKKSERGKVYDDVLKSLLKKGVGKYEISIPKRTPSTVYLSLIKRKKAQKLNNIELHFIAKTVYAEVLSK